MVRNKAWDQAGAGERQDWLEKPHRALGDWGEGGRRDKLSPGRPEVLHLCDWREALLGMGSSSGASGERWLVRGRLALSLVGW